MSLPLISIVLCTYNGEAFLQAQLQSLVAQTYPNLEVIISDDASTDGTKAILEQYKKYGYFKLFYQSKNTGPVKNFEFVIKQASGAYIAFCDQDDVWAFEKVAKLYAAIGDDLLVYCDSELIDDKGESLHKKLSGLRNMYSGSNTRGFVFSNVVWGHTVLISRALVPFILPIPHNIPHDIWIGFKAATLGGIKYVDEPLTQYRQHSTSITKTIATDVVRRSDEKRWTDYKEKLHWIGVMRDNERPEEQKFYAQLYRLYAAKKSGHFQWKLFYFLAKHQQELFMFSRKKKLSQFIEVMKQARGVKKV